MIEDKDLDIILKLHLDASRYRWVRTAGAWDSEIGMSILSENPEDYDRQVDINMKYEYEQSKQSY